jgi:hypothetical protein
MRCCVAGSCSDWDTVDMFLLHVRTGSPYEDRPVLIQRVRMLLFLIFFPRPTQSEIETQIDERMPTWKEAVIVLSGSLAFFIFTFLGSIVMVYAAPSHLYAWANFLGLLGTLLAAIQYFPQIITTYKLQETGSLSVPMMCIQTPGSFVFAASLAVRLGPGGWSAWGLFIFTGILQGCLLVMSLGFVWRDMKAAKKAKTDGDANGNGHSEQSPLLVDSSAN